MEEKDLVQIAPVEVTLNVQKKEEERYAAALKIIAEILIEIVNLIPVRIQTHVVKTQSVKQMAIGLSVVVQGDGLEILRQVADVLIILVMSNHVAQMLIVKTGKEKLYAHAGLIMKETHLLTVN